MQVMGALARELGLQGPIPQLLDPTLGADYGCRHLANLRRRFHADHGWRGVVQAYNSGHPQHANVYPDKVAQAGAQAGAQAVLA
jgi:soluble lytic murein transglycosylase-like protein